MSPRTSIVVTLMSACILLAEMSVGEFLTVVMHEIQLLEPAKAKLLAGSGPEVPNQFCPTVTVTPCPTVNPEDCTSRSIANCLVGQCTKCQPAPGDKYKLCSNPGYQYDCDAGGGGDVCGGKLVRGCSLVMAGFPPTAVGCGCPDNGWAQAGGFCKQECSQIDP